MLRSGTDIAWQALVAAALMTTGCSGGGSSGGRATTTSTPPGPPPTPSPAPTPTPIPAPAPAPSPTTFSYEPVRNPTRDAGYHVFGARLSLESIVNAATITRTRSIDSFLPPYTALDVVYTQQPHRYRVGYNTLWRQIDREEQSFTQTDQYVNNEHTGAYQKGQIGDRYDSFSKVTYRQPLSYVAGGWWNTEETQRSVGAEQIGRKIERIFVFGSMTQGGDLPTAGAIRYTAEVGGFRYEAGREAPVSNGGDTSASGLKIDFATGAVSGNLSLGPLDCGLPANPQPCRHRLAEFSGVLHRDQIRIEGTVRQLEPAGGFEGRFIGSVFGPSAREIGVAFQLKRPDGAHMTGHAIGTIRP